MQQTTGEMEQLKPVLLVKVFERDIEQITDLVVTF